MQHPAILEGKKKEKNEDNASINSSITGTNKTKRKHDFNKLYEEFMFKKRLHEQALMVLRENKERREAKMCTGRPSINRDYKIKIERELQKSDAQEMSFYIS